MSPSRQSGRLIGVLMLGLLAGLARADGPELRVGMKALPRSPNLVLKDGDRSIIAPANPRVFVVERIEGDKVWLFHGAQKGQSKAADVVPVDRAIPHFDATIKANPRAVFGYSVRAIAHRENRNCGGALADCDAAIRLDPRSAYAYLERADCYYLQEKYDKALPDANQAIGLDPKSSDAFLCRVYCYYAQQDFPKAVVDLDEAIRLNPRNADALVRRADLLTISGQTEKALADLNRSIELNPKNRDAST